MHKITDYKPISNNQQAGLFAKCMPQGLAWDNKGDKDSNLYKLIKSLATEINALEEKIYRLVTQWDVRITEDLIVEWENAVGIPDECRDRAEDIITRRNNILDKLRKIPTITVADYLALAQSITQTYTEDNFLVGHWKLNDNAATTVVLDGSSRGNNGVATANTDTFDAVGKIGGALDMGGTNYAVVPDKDFYSFDDSQDKPFSISAWVFVTAFGTSQTIISKDSATKFEWRLFYDSVQTLELQLFDQPNNKDAFALNGGNLVLGVWNHVVCTYDGRGGVAAADGIRLYVNTVEDSAVHTTQAGYANMLPSDADIEIGARRGGIEIHQDKLDDLRIYRKVLTQTEIDAIYNEGNGTEETVLNTPSETVADPPLEFNIRPGSEDFPNDPLYKFVLLVSPPSLTAGAFDYPFGSGFESGIGITRSGTTVTVTVSDTSTMVNGGLVVIAGANQSEYNGTHTITSIPTGATFTYEIAGTPATPATGTITVTFGIDQTQLDAIAINLQFLFDDTTVFSGYPLSGKIRTDILKCVFRKVTPANVTVVFD